MSALYLAHAIVDIENAASTTLVRARNVGAAVISAAHRLGILGVENNATAAEASLEEGRKLAIRSGELKPINTPDK